MESLDFYPEGHVIPSKNLKERKPLNQIGISVPLVGPWATAGKNVGKKGG